MLLPLIIRGSKFVIGLGFAFVLMLALIGTVSTAINSPTKKTAEEELHLKPKDVTFASDGPFGKFDVAQLQRGFHVYKEVCSNCHSLSLASFRELEGIGYNEAQVKKIAADWGTKQPTFDPKTGDRGERTNRPSDHFPAVYYAANGTPPDLTLIAKARHGGGAYVYSLLTGYKTISKEEQAKAPDFKTPEGGHFNPYFANLNIAMPPPLTTEGQVEYTDGTRATVDNMAKDVAAFLTWTAEPTAQTRKQTGFAVIGFLLLTCLLAFGAYRSVWAGVKH